MACLPSGDLDAYSRGGDDVSVPVDGGMFASSTPGVDPGPGTAGDETDPGMLAPSDPPSDGEQNTSSNGMTSGDAGSPVAAVPGRCAAGEVLGPDDHCQFIQTVALSWDAARASCRARGTGWDLGVVRSEDENTFLAAQITAQVWLGATDAASEGNWIWVDDGAPFWVGESTGDPVGGAYTNWNVNEPNGGGTSDCVRALPDTFASRVSGAPWADLSCADLRASLCEDHGVVE